MQRLQSPKFLIQLLLVSSLLTPMGCSSGPSTKTGPGGSTASTPQATPFKGQPLPARVTDLQGTALVTMAPELEKSLGNKAPEKGGFFVLLNSADPQQGVLVLVPSINGEELGTKPSSKILVTGNVKSFPASALKKQILDQYHLSLTGSGDQAQYIVAEGELFPTPTPSASASPQASQTPQAAKP